MRPYTFIKSFSRAVILIFIFHIFPFDRISAVDFDQVYEYYKKGNYDILVRVSRPALRSGEFDYKILLLYVASEASLEEIDKTLLSIYGRSKEQPAIFYNSVFLFLERALVLEAYESGARWGKIFMSKGESSVRYSEGVYTYACILYSSQEYEAANSVLDKIKSVPSDSKLGKRIRILEMNLDKKKEEK
ncbi:hypothetical protein [Leptospira sarikeiensis]|uniref:Tetratricopeptide repeat protein n=1 Tax=Leptospira sarikeiensis TaxID=2484943 RepID=A0A4R9KEB9_9LEPT|nr:hypothetical protein [Leptospira sarikeiensis]TGL64616.1 hypothetical protein EHQ64_01855 [Leptospira sarikeiensis]